MVDITTEAQAIASGFLGPDPSWQPSNAFDDVYAYNATDAWASLASNSSSPDVVTKPAYIGQDFGEGNTATLDEIKIQQSANSGNRLSGQNAISLEYSDNGTTWTEHEKFWPNDDATLQTFTLGSSTPAKRYFRIRALKNPPGIAGSVWGVMEVEMHGTTGAGGDAGGAFALGIGRRGRVLRRRR